MLLQYSEVSRVAEMKLSESRRGGNRLRNAPMVWLDLCIVILAAIPLQAQQDVKPRKHAMPMPGMQMGHENHTPASNLRSDLMKAWNAADLNHATRLFGSSALVILPNGTLVTGPQSIREFLQQRVTNGVHVSFNSVGFDSSPDLEVDFGVFTESKATKANASEAHHDLLSSRDAEGKYLMVVKHFGSDWKIQEMVFVGANLKF